MVQPDQRLWVHQSIDRGEGRVRPYLGRGARWHELAQRRSERRVRARHQSRQDLGGEPQGRLSSRLHAGRRIARAT